MLDYLKNKKGATVIEAVVIMLILAIIGATVVGIIAFFAQLFMYSPRQLDTQKIGQELTNIMIEGNQDIRGIRYARNIIDASAAQFSYTYGYPMPTDQLSVRFRWDPLDKHIYRSTSSDGGSSWSPETVISYYTPSAVTIDGKDTAGVIFQYKKAADANWIYGTDSLVSIRRLIISVNIRTGSGSFTGMQGTSNLTASIEIKGY